MPLFTPPKGASGVVSDNFMASVHALSRECSGDGALLIDRLRDRVVSGFGQSKTDKLAQWLEEENYISPDTPWDAEERCRRVLIRMEDGFPVQEAGSVISWLEAGVGNS